jgi:tetratricopeptide (TPR) repeat protein
LADTAYETTRKVSALVRARSALKKADSLRPNDYETLWRLARLDAVLALFDRKNAGLWAKDGWHAGTKARALKPGRVEGQLYYALCTTLRARDNPGDSQALIKEALAAAQLARKIDSDFGGGEPDRLVGGIYIYAPSWPTGVGDLDEGIEILEQLVKRHPKQPIGVFLLADAYRRVGQNPDAVRLFKRVLSFPPKGLWHLEARRYRGRARQALTDLRRGP